MRWVSDEMEKWWDEWVKRWESDETRELAVKLHQESARSMQFVARCLNDHVCPHRHHSWESSSRPQGMFFCPDQFVMASTFLMGVFGVSFGWTLHLISCCYVQAVQRCAGLSNAKTEIWEIDVHEIELAVKLHPKSARSMRLVARYLNDHVCPYCHHSRGSSSRPTGMISSLDEPFIVASACLMGVFGVDVGWTPILLWLCHVQGTAVYRVQAINHGLSDTSFAWRQSETRRDRVRRDETE